MSDTWNRATTGARDVMTFGANLTSSTISRFGSETCVIEIAWLPAVAGAIDAGLLRGGDRRALAVRGGDVGTEHGADVAEAAV